MIERNIIDEVVKILYGREGSTEYAYFFNQLSKPDWINPLNELGYFKRPPSADSKPFYWAESKYLLRMLEHESGSESGEIADQVAAIAAELPPTANESVHEDFTQAAMKMPPHLADQWALKEIAWLRGQPKLYRSLAHYLGQLIEYLAANGFADTALSLAVELLAISVDPKLFDKLAEEEANPPDDEELFFPYTPEPQIKFEEYTYEEILSKRIPGLVKFHGMATFRALCDLLDDAITYSRRPDEDSDYSRFARPTIEDDENDVHIDVKYALTGALRDSAMSIIESDLSMVHTVLDHLDSDKLKRWSYFQRLALYLVKRSPNASADLISQYLVNRDLFDSYHCEIEYWDLAKARFGDLSNSDQTTIIDWMLGSEKEQQQSIGERYKEWHKEEASNEQMIDFMHEWFRDTFVPIKEFLPQNLQKRFVEAEAKMGPWQSPDSLPGQVSGGWVGPTSPVSRDEISDLSVEELIDFLHFWEPSEGWMSSSRDGLARLLSVVVGAEPDKYSPEIKTFIAEKAPLHPVYIRGFIEGFFAAAKDDRYLDWEKVLLLCRWIMDQDREFPKSIPTTESIDDLEERDWGYTRRRVAALLEQGLREKENAGIAFEMRDMVWSILKDLAGDPDPDSEREIDKESWGDPADLAINSVRGEAMHSIMFYIMWTLRHTNNPKESKVSNITLEAFELFDYHLDLEAETSLAIRSVFGRWLPYLITWDSSWVKKHRSAILPTDPKLQDYWDAVWGTYLKYNRPYDNVYPVLEEQYKRAFSRIGQISSTGLSVDERLVEHLVLYYARGIIDLETGGLISTLFNEGSEDMRAHAIYFLGHTIDGTASTEVINRLSKLWDWRIAIIEANESISENTRELENFGWWISSGQFSPEWSVNNLLGVQAHGVKAYADKETLSKLSEYAGDYPLEVVKVFSTLVEGEPEYWEMYSWLEPGKKLLQRAIDSENVEAINAAITLVNKLVSMGHLSYREVRLPKQN